MARVYNPSRRERNLVCVYNPGWLSRLLSGGDADASPKSAGARAVFKQFRGREPKGVALLEARPGTPKTLAELGGLCELSFDAETLNKRVLHSLGFTIEKDEQQGDPCITFSPKRVKLVSDAEGDLHIVGFYIPLPGDLRAGRSYYLGAVVNVVYSADKPHIEGDIKSRQYTHEFCEDYGDDFPALYYRDGFLFLKGGSYTVTAAGLVN
jgi:hypothetical protein